MIETTKRPAVRLGRADSLVLRGTAGSGRLPLALALIACVASMVGALGPAESLRTIYSWPSGGARPAGSHSYAPLLLAKHRPSALTVRFACSPPTGRAPARQPEKVLATSRAPVRNGGLAVSRDGTALLVTVGANRLTRVRLGSAGSGDCTVRLAGGRWSISAGPTDSGLDGDLDTMPSVSGLFSDLDLRSNDLRVEVTTEVHASRPTTLQTLAWATALLAAAGALWLVAFTSRFRNGGRLGSALRAHAFAADSAVAVVLLVWWVLSPAAWDDGWVVARQRGFAASGGFSNYYDALGVNLPNGYWLEWLQHWTVQESNTLVVLRLPSLLCLFGIWLLCRWCLERVAPGTGGRPAWVMAAGFLAGALAWGMTLRPEPFIALLVTSCLACAIMFRTTLSTTPLAVSAALVPLALTGHHAGLVALAPLLAVSPTLWKWTRANKRTAVTIVLSSVALALVFASLGADLGQRLADAVATRRYGLSTGDPWWDEFMRYERLNGIPHAAPLRVASVALMGLAILAFLGRRSRSCTVLDVPVWTLLAALALFVFVPTKLPQHFGVLMGVSAVAIASEAARMRREAVGAQGLALRPLVLIAAAFAALGWAWSGRSEWNTIDLRTLDWTPRLETYLPLQVVAPLLPMLILAWVSIVGGRRRARTPQRFYSGPWRVAFWSAPIIVAPMIAFTAIILVADSAKTGSWTLARQNLDSFRGAETCGLASDALVRDGPARQAVRLSQLLERDGALALVLPNLLTYVPCARLPQLRDGVAEVPDYIVSTRIPRAPGLPVSVRYPSSPFYGLLDLYGVRELQLTGPNPPRQIAVFAVDRRIPGATEVSPTRRTSTS